MTQNFIRLICLLISLSLSRSPVSVLFAEFTHSHVSPALCSAYTILLNPFSPLGDTISRPNSYVMVRCSRELPGHVIAVYGHVLLALSGYRLLSTWEEGLADRIF